MSDLKLDVDQAGEIKAAFRRERGSNGSEWTNEKIKALTERKGLFGGVLDVLESRAAIVLQLELEKKPDPILDTIIRVDRSIRPVYPDWVKTVMHPELENTGPDEYDLATIEPWLHDGQKNGKWIGGQDLYEHHKKYEMLASSLSLRDGEEIQKKGIVVFRKFFGGKAVFLWKSVVQDRDGNLDVPCLVGRGDEVVVLWYWLGLNWDGGYPALRFAS